ncbi:MAG: TolC family protein [Chitinophagia bacterium]|nr:TolC family protein [Chitinophagia bacterium]
MKSKYILLVATVILFLTNATAQTRTIGLKECINLALANKSNILALNAEATIDSLNIKQILAKNLPQIALAYDYLYNPIIRTNIVPVGQFSQIPTKETRAIKFGTTYNQMAGLQVMQPIFDATIRSKIKDSQLQYRIKKDQVASANAELIFEVAKTFVSILAKQDQLKISKFDTLRTASTLKIVGNKFSDGNISKMDFNKAKINHNNSIFAYKELISDLIVEKIYLAFLINLQAKTIDVVDVDKIFTEQNLNVLTQSNETKILPKISELDSKILLVQQQISGEKVKYLPKLFLNGYLGADQFSNDLKPFQSNTWFGNSFLGLALRLPITIGENKLNKISQFQSQIKSLNFQKEEELKESEKNKQIALQEIGNLKEEAKSYSLNVDLLKENVQLYNERLLAGQETYENVNLEEIEYQKETQKLNNVNNKIWQQWLLVLKNAGMLDKLK